MGIFKALILGLLQGLTEFIPVSSSGHLVLAKHFLNIETVGITFEAFVHLGSLLAVLIYFRKELINLLKSLVFFKEPQLNNNRRICLYLCLATIVTGFIGFIFNDMFQDLFNNPLLVACMLIVTGLVLILSDRIETGNLRSDELNVKKSLFIGLGQALAIIPGLSRSGTTITFSLLTGLNRKSAASFAFLLSIPAIIGANILEFKSLMSIESTMIFHYSIGFLAAFLSGYLVISWLIKLIIKAKLHYFSYYCFALATFCIFIILIN